MTLAQDVIETIGGYGVVPVVVIDEAESATALGVALKSGGIRVAEVTLRTSASERALSLLATNDDLLVGAGTVLTVEQLDRSINAGARFIVSPGLDPDLVLAAAQRGVPIIPGVATATEIQRAIGLGVNTVKLFPAEQLGGAAAVRALSAPFPGVRFVPTGGVDLNSLGDYLSLPAVLAVGGSWLVAAELIRGHRWDEIATLTEQALMAARRARTTGSEG